PVNIEQTNHIFKKLYAISLLIMPSAAINRRNFLSTMGSLSVGSMIPARDAICSLSGLEHSTAGDYLFSPGLIYLNTGTIGPCSKKTFEETTAIWKQLESLPLQFYPARFAPQLAE